MYFFKRLDNIRLREWARILYFFFLFSLRDEWKENIQFIPLVTFEYYLDKILMEYFIM